MPCYTVVKISIQFKVGNVDLLKKALEKIGWVVDSISGQKLYAHKAGSWAKDKVEINLERSTISGVDRNFTPESLTVISNQFKRSYSEVVIDEVAKKNKWFTKKLNANQYQLQRF